VETYQTEQDSFQDHLPSIPKFLELVPLQPASLHGQLTDALEHSNHNGDNRDESNEENQSGQEDIRRFDSCTETNSFDAFDDDDFSSFGDAGITVAPLEHLRISSIG